MEFKRRFPNAVGRIQQLDLGVLHFFLLDTNERAMSRLEWQTQLDEFRAALAAAEGSDRVRHVLVAGHHPPFTNARWHSPSKAVQDAFVEPFLACSKSRTFLSGHVLGYEHFRIERRSFIVTGGGGGARFSHLHGDKLRQKAKLDLADPHPLHYLDIEASPMPCFAGCAR